MRILCDSHIHIYPNYDLVRAFDSLCAGFDSADTSGGSIRAAIFCERYDCQVFSKWRKSKSLTPVTEVEKVIDGALVIRHRGAAVTVFAGRQLNTKERLEFLAYGVEEHICDRQPWEKTIESIRSSGGMPVLNWAAGKWMFKRRTIAEEIVRSVSVAELALCDTTLRAIGWPEPYIMSSERARGRVVFAGSDPLPYKGEEELLGSYGLRAEIPINCAGLDMLRGLIQSNIQHSTFGSRSTPLEFLLRQGRHFLSK